ncbi:MAG: hypothetical protein M3R24_28345 [Chloroflexota bacterium]|nr:hypothetical protein [Chloroflexota bacterium]
MDQRRDEFRQLRRQLERDQKQSSSEADAPRPRPEHGIRAEDAVRETTDEEQARRPRPRVPPGGVARRPASVRQMLRRNLATRGALRQAIVLRDILGPPKALRGPDDGAY